MVPNRGHMHPLTQVAAEAVTAFKSLGFEVAEGPQVETEYYNFDALNMSADHPARDMQDSFWIKPLTDKKVLRTQTSPVQIRFMEANKPPLRIVAPGKVFRNEATDARHEAQFHQIEGLLIDHDVNVGHLKWYLDAFFAKLFGPGAVTRFRPSFFPFVEPAFEVDTSCVICGGTGRDGTCSVCGGSGWLEICGAGLVHPSVLEAAKVDPQEWSGFAFGMGIERLAMIKYGIDDIRAFSAGDLRFLKQF